MALKSALFAMAALLAFAMPSSADAGGYKNGGYKNGYYKNGYYKNGYYRNGYYRNGYYRNGTQAEQTLSGRVVAIELPN